MQVLSMIIDSYWIDGYSLAISLQHSRKRPSDNFLLITKVACEQK